MSLSTLHEVPLLRIFYYLPMSDLLLRVNLVCHRWNDLLPTATSQRRSLVLIIGHNRESITHFNPFGIPFLSELKDSNALSGIASVSQLEYTKYSECSRVEFSRLSTEKIVRLTTLLSNIISLTLILRNPNDYSVIFQLLWSFWANKLVTLKIVLLQLFNFCLIDVSTYFWNGFFGRIYELSKLKNFTFYCNENIDYQVRLPLMSKLEKFNFYLPEDNIELGVWESVRRYTSHRMRQLGLLNNLPRNNPNLDYDGDTQVAATFTHLSFDKILNFDIDRFRNVTTVKLSNFSSRPISLYFLPLRKLPQLIHVILYFEFKTFVKALTSLASTMSEVELTSVKVLSFHFEWIMVNCKYFASDLFEIAFKFFPKIQYFSFLAYNCGCSSSEHTYCPEYCTPLALTCSRKWLRILKSVKSGEPNEEPKKLSLLSHVEITVFSSDFYRKWSIEEL